VAAQSRWDRPCPNVIATGNPTKPTANTAEPIAITGAGQAVPADSSVHQGTPNRSSMIEHTIAKRTNLRRARGRSARSARTVWDSDIAFPRYLRCAWPIGPLCSPSAAATIQHALAERQRVNAESRRRREPPR
jgi:hypothetical protein